MTWVRLDDGFAMHPKVVRLSDAAFRAHVLALCYAGHYLTDGFVPTEVLPAEGIVAELVGVGLWHPASGGIDIHDYDHYQPSRAEVREAMQRKTDRQREAGRARAGRAGRRQDGRFVGTEPATQPANHPASGPASDPASSQPGGWGVVASQNPAPSHPIPSHPEDQHLAPLARRDLLFEAVAEVCDIDIADLTPALRGALNKAVRDIRAVNGDDPDEVRRRAANWPYDFAITPAGFAKWWAGLSNPPRTRRGNAALDLAARLAAEGR